MARRHLLRLPRHHQLVTNMSALDNSREPATPSMAVIFTTARDTALYCFSPLAGNTPDQNRRTCATLGGPFTEGSGYLLFSITFSGNTFQGTGNGFGLTFQIRGQISGTQLTGRIDSSDNLFQTFTMTQR